MIRRYLLELLMLALCLLALGALDNEHRRSVDATEAPNRDGEALPARAAQSIGDWPAATAGRPMQ